MEFTILFSLISFETNFFMKFLISFLFIKFISFLNHVLKYDDFE